MPNRHESSDKYRYGFQGQEKDDEIKGEGNAINYKFRMHDPRVGRFFAVDPLTAKYPWYTPYSFSGNKVFASTELESMEEQIVIYHYNSNKPIVSNISNTEIDAFNNLRKGIYLSMPNRDVLSKRSDFRNWDSYNRNRMNSSGTVIGKNREWFGPNSGTLYIFEDSEGYNQYVYQPFSPNLKPKSPSIKRTFDAVKRAFDWYSNSDDRFAKGFRQNMKNTALASAAVVTAPVAAEYGLLSVSTFEIGALKTAVSASIQATLDNGRFDFVSALADGYLMPGVGDAIGSSFDINIDKDGKISGKSIFNGTKTYKEFVKQTAIGTAFGVKSSFTQSLLKNKAVGATMFEAPYQFANYGTQKKANTKNP